MTPDPAAYAAIESASAPAFSQDGRTLFHLRGAGLAQVWALDLDTGAARPLTRHDERVALLRRAPNDDRLIYGIDAGGDERQQLWLLDGPILRALTANPAAIHAFGAWHPDGARIGLAANDRDEAHFDILALDVATGAQTRLWHGTHEVLPGPWHPVGDRMIALMDRSSGDQRPIIVHLDGQAQPVPRTRPTRFASLRWDGDALMGLTDAEGRDWMALCRIDPETGEPIGASDKQSWTSVFAEELVVLAGSNPTIVGITAAMLRPTGLQPLASKYPERVFDVGIAEQHAVTSAAGLAFGGLHPVVALYATFINRAFDQVLMDVALHKAGVTFVLDRAGVTGPDGPSHHGIWDLAILQVVPHIRLSAPRDAIRLREELGEAVAVTDSPTVVRFSKGNVGTEIPAVRRLPDGVDVLSEASRKDVLIITVGPMAEIGLEVAARLGDQGIGATVIDPRWVVPVPKSVITLAAKHRLVVTIEDGIRVGGIGTRIRQELRAAGVDTALNELGLPDEFLEHGSRAEILEEAGLTPQQIARDVVEQVLGSKIPVARPLTGEVREGRSLGSDRS